VAPLYYHRITTIAIPNLPHSTTFSATTPTMEQSAPSPARGARFLTLQSRINSFASSSISIKKRPFPSPKGNGKRYERLSPFVMSSITDEVFLTCPSICGFRKRFQMFRKASITLETRSVSGLADLVDGSGEVEHLAPEAPLVVVPDMRLRCLLVYTLPGSAHPLFTIRDHFLQDQSVFTVHRSGSHPFWPVESVPCHRRYLLPDRPARAARPPDPATAPRV